MTKHEFIMRLFDNGYGLTLDQIERAEAYIMVCNENDVTYSIDKYLYEYDIDGHYYYSVA